MIFLKEKYEKEVIPAMMKEFNLKSKMAVPRIEKVVINVGIGKMVTGQTSGEVKKIVATISKDLSEIAGQKPIVTKARKSIAGFKVRAGMFSGVAVVLRKKRMIDFLDRLINVALPRSRDFSGLKTESVDNEGNLTIAIKEQISFPEILPENVKKSFGLGITVVTTTHDREKGLALLKLIGFPFKKIKK